MTAQLTISILFGLAAGAVWFLLSLWAYRPVKVTRKTYVMTAFGWREK